MSVPFSNTNLRIPRGFGTILEGMAREVLRDQPEDIPYYAALYFDALLAQREESGMDPAEWAAKLEDRFYNNHAFKANGPEKEPATEVTISKEKSCKSKIEDESNHSAEASNPSNTQPDVSEEVDVLTESTEEEEEEEEEENGDITEKKIVSTEKGPALEESVNRPPSADVHSDELSGTVGKTDPTINTFDQVDKDANEKDSSSVVDQDKSHSEFEPRDSLSLVGNINVDVLAQELEMAKEVGVDKQETAVVDKDIDEGEENTDNEEPLEVFPYSGLADMDVCATELGGTEGTLEGAAGEDNGQESSEAQPEKTDAQSSLSISVTPIDNRHEVKYQAKNTKEEEGTETGPSPVDMHESVSHKEGGLDSNVVQKEDSLVEICFEDVPEVQQIREVGEKQPEENGSVEVLETTMLEMKAEDTFEEAIAVAAIHNTSGTKQDHAESAMLRTEQEVDSEGGEMESQHEDTNDSNLNDSDGDDKEEVVRNTSSLQPTPKADVECPEDEINHKDEDTNRIIEGELQQIEDSEKDRKSNDADSKEEERTDEAGGDRAYMYTEGYSEAEDQEMNDGGGGNRSSHASLLSNISSATVEAERESTEASEEHPLEENEEITKALVESQPEDTAVGKEVTAKESTSEAVVEPVEEGTIDSDLQEESDAVCKESSISLTPSADGPAADHHGEEERPLGSEMELEGNSGDKQEECSRPQEEEDIMDIPLDDPEANRAAAKIQAGFRGHMTRKKMKPEDKAEGEERQADRGQ